ncbi:hypothetical protein C5Y96_06330 [Blastopirellula marina]|uniref:Uncharacterized protein n=1 Tax=Blastopirellula marina TaxID=124 RepID=A0A2S8FX78_9BACT|nr:MULTISPECIES: CbrC family protein [Pirellulaceae]PQO36781.1 hypothetical protein C5Y96_06330 [Blastopirellula marina]RCS53496.1 hypothetical protein DTL36_06340 [Bremerella cremea]
MKTFAQLGIPFPLFEAPISETSDYLGISQCEICEQREQHCFRLNNGDHVVVRCPQCQTENGLRANCPGTFACQSCASSLTLPGRSKREGVRICFSCLREGKGAIGKDTEFGAVWWENALLGHTHGVPGLKAAGFETVILDPEENWAGVRLSQEKLFELLRTPSFSTWQGEIWLFCCKSPMTYIGEWQSVSASLEEEESRKLFGQLTAEIEEFPNWDWESVSNPDGGVSLYAFQCKQCGHYRANYDMD